MRRKAHAGTAIVATIETQMIHKRSKVFVPRTKRPLPRFRAPEAKFLNTLAKEIKNTKFKELRTP